MADSLIQCHPTHQQQYSTLLVLYLALTSHPVGQVFLQAGRGILCDSIRGWPQASAPALNSGHDSCQLQLKINNT